MAAQCAAGCTKHRLSSASEQEPNTDEADDGDVRT